MSLGHGASIIRDGLVLQLDAANPKSYPGTGSVWEDISGNSYTMHFVNNPTHTGTSFILNGADQRASGTGFPSYSASEEYAIELWFRLKTLPTEEYGNNSHILLGQVGNSHTVFAYPAINGRSSLGMCYDDSRYSETHRSSKAVAADEWVQFVINGYPSTYGDLEYYINGSLDTSRFGTTDVNGSTFSSSYLLGFDSRWGTYSNLEISSIKVYNKTLSGLEAKQNFEAQRSRFNI